VVSSLTGYKHENCVSISDVVVVVGAALCRHAGSLFFFLHHHYTRHLLYGRILW